MKALFLTALALSIPSLAEARDCQCKAAHDAVAGLSYFEVLCNPASAAVEIVHLPRFEAHSENVRVVGFDNPASASDNLLYYTMARDIHCAE